MPYGNVECVPSGSSCEVPTLFGFVSGCGVRFITDSTCRRVVPFIVPIPHSNTVMTFTTEPVEGVYLHFRRNFASVITAAVEADGSTSYHISGAPDGALSDAGGHLLPAWTDTASFSANANWMVVDSPSRAMLRVNLSTFEVLPFGLKTEYGVGSNPFYQTAITNDGHYAAVASPGQQAGITLYDLTTCGTVPTTILNPVSCGSRSLDEFVRAMLPTYTGRDYGLRFIDDKTLSFYAGYAVGTVERYAKLVVAAGSLGASRLQYLALGDSFSAGEGAFDYRPGTDYPANMCHLSQLSYPYLIAAANGLTSSASVACSGARSWDVVNRSQYPGGAAGDPRTTFTPGAIPQIEFVKTYQPDVVTIGIGGNDIGFSSILKSCADLRFPPLPSTCYRTYEERLTLVRDINAYFYAWSNLFSEVKIDAVPGARVYVIGYPQTVYPGGDCAVNVKLNLQDAVFANQLVSYLNTVLQRAAARAGVAFVDVATAFAGHRLCETSSWDVAVNGLTAGNDIHHVGGNESYHPNSFGQQLLANAILAKTSGLTEAMPLSADPSAAPPPEAGQEILNVAHDGTTVVPSMLDACLVRLDACLSPPLTSPGESVRVSFNGLDYGLKPLTSYSLSLHSAVTSLGTASTDTAGVLDTTVTIPTSVSPGWHELHVTGANLAGAPVDIVQPLLVGVAAGDLNGNGIPDDSEPCGAIPSSGSDTDRDGIDDGCDGYIGAPPTDATPPTTSADAPTAWAIADVTVHLSATDDSSGVARTYYEIDAGGPQIGNTVVVPAPADHSNDGVHTVSYYSVDNTGNAEAAHVTTVKIDTTRPTVIATETPVPNSQGWNNSDVTVAFTCADSESGIKTCPRPITLGERGTQSVTGTAIDNAGNSASVTVSEINVDETPPMLTGAPTTSPNANGWYNADVTIHWTCSDNLSGVAGTCPADEVTTGEGALLTANESVVDLAGNVTAATSAPVKIDRTPPVTTASKPSDWSNSGVTVALLALDNLSGVAATFYQVDGGPIQAGTSAAINDEGIHTLNFWSTDSAGNAEMSKSVFVRIDKTAPTITHVLNPLPNGVGWNRASVMVQFICGDSLSGIVFCTAAQLLTGEGQSQPVQGNARDNAGNTANDAAFVSIDLTSPSVSADADRPANSNGWYNAPVKVSFTCADLLSGVALCPAAITLNEGASQTAFGTAADTAGNTRSASLSNINVDMTAPVVTYNGNASTYTADQTVNIACSTSDSLSGVATSTCSNINGPAWSFGLGTTSRSASATDRAGNTGTGSTSFTVVVTAASLDNLITQFFGGNTGGASGLIAKANAIASAPNANAKNGALGAFDNQVNAKIGNPLTSDQANLLKQLAGAL